MKKDKRKIIVISIIILFFILNTITYKGYYYTVSAKNNHITAYIKWNKAIHKADFPTEDPKTEYKLSGTDTKLINILNTFYIMKYEDGNKNFHIHFIFFDFEFSNKVEIYFWHGNNHYSNKAENLLSVNNMD